jgi:hypothetical protein
MVKSMLSLGILVSLLGAGCAAPVLVTPTVVVAPSASPDAPPSAGAAGSPTDVPAASAAPSVVVTPAPTATPTAPAQKLGPDTFAVVVTDDLVIRSQPGISEDSAVYKPNLGRREQLYVLDGPVRRSGYDWYEVMPLSAEVEDTGWVAAASKAGEPWIKPLASAAACPTRPSTVTELDALPSGVRLACLSRVPISVRAQLAGCGVDLPDAMYEPEMFNGFYDPNAEELVPIMLGEPGTDPCELDRQLQLIIDPATVSAAEVRIGDVAELTGLFDHPAARDCVFVSFLVDERQPEPEWCRPQFVVTHIE